eukprot:TRINITY_DN50825_c0_g1_i1.p1 TRINITY_DN50825_c0_g1~~TRINITY_DN50825_c0_g1_i1.p1  ORF type:complete len:216 (+),score=16.17 TRINITY_DN50825_c0_g1_i1:258-905(+)
MTDVLYTGAIRRRFLDMAGNVKTVMVSAEEVIDNTHISAGSAMCAIADVLKKEGTGSSVEKERGGETDFFHGERPRSSEMMYSGRIGILSPKLEGAPAPKVLPPTEILDDDADFTFVFLPETCYWCNHVLDASLPPENLRTVFVRVAQHLTQRRGVSIEHRVHCKSDDMCYHNYMRSCGRSLCCYCGEPTDPGSPEWKDGRTYHRGCFEEIRMRK